VSVPEDIIQLLGTGSVPVVVAGSVLGAFELIERLASQRAKDALSKWLLTFDIQKAKALPDGTKELFEKIFGERHLSLKCFVRSAAFSLGAMVFVGLILLLINPRIISVLGSYVSASWELRLMLWLPWSILIDYVSLFKTRFILGVIARMRRRNELAAAAIAAIDYVVYRFLFIFGLLLVVLRFKRCSDPDEGHPFFRCDDWSFFDAFNSDFTSFPFIPGIAQGWFSIFFWAGLAPSIWMWLYVLALFVTRGLLRSEKLVNWLRWALDVEKNPFRSIGAVAATLAFIVSVVIILVSAEVSKISTATAMP
jgi:hypothetical protein